MTYLQSLRRNSGECSPRDAFPLLPENQWGNSPSLLQQNGRESPRRGGLPPPSQKLFFPRRGKGVGRTLERGDLVNRSFSRGRVGGDFLSPFRRNSGGLSLAPSTEMLAAFCVILFTLAASTERLARQKHWRRCSSIPSIHRVERVLHDLTKEWSGTSSLPRFRFSSTLSFVRLVRGTLLALLQNTWGRFLYGVKMVLGQFWGFILTPHVILVTQDARWRLRGHDGHVVSLTVNTFLVHMAKKPPVSWRE